ncbi:MAG TPA: efflux RND transporter periplasmic adaptor subunit [Methylomirabilota bacterium]|nr:efflux RND transporter periplasmic adaptor subunit [Methylomirabilota bacterium]
MSHARFLGLMLALAAGVAGCTGEGNAPAAASAPAPVSSGNFAVETIGGEVIVPPGSPQAAQLKIEPVSMRDLAVDEVTAPGRIGIDPNRSSRLLLPVAGRVVAVLAKVGDSVEEGQPVLSVDSPDADAAIAAALQAEAAERQAQAALGKSDADLARTTELYEHHAVAQKDLLGAQNDQAQARAALETARAALQQTRRKLELLDLKLSGESRQLVRVRAPISGKVLEVNVAPGEYRNDTGTPLMTIADLSRVWIASDVPESAIRFIHVGGRVTITMVAYPTEELEGRVARIADVLDPQTRTVKVYVDMANPGGRFRPEMFVTIRHTGAPRPTPVLPIGAVVQEYGHPIVFLERTPGRFERREVVLGPRAGAFMPIVSGVRAGERVVVDGGVLLKDR